MDKASLRSFLITAVVVANLSACSAVFRKSETAPAGGPVEISALRPKPIEQQTVQRQIPRTELLQALQQGEVINSPRIVQIFFRSGETDLSFPVYRLFEVHPKSAYALLGLQAADVIVAANNYIIFNQQQFRNYIRALPQQSEGSIEIKRAGQPLLLTYRITD